MEPKHIVSGLAAVIIVFAGIVWLSSGTSPNTTPAPETANIITPLTNNTETASPSASMNTQEALSEKVNVTIKTAKGNIALELYPKAAPKTVQNFVEKARAKYFDGLKFHRVEDWVLQGGDPLSKDDTKQQLWGTGGGNIATELSQLPFVIGAVGVARGPDIAVSNDSQFFIVKKDAQFLNNQYTLFGQVVEGMDVVQKMEPGDTISSITIE